MGESSRRKTQKIGGEQIWSPLLFQGDYAKATKTQIQARRQIEAGSWTLTDVLWFRLMKVAVLSVYCRLNLALISVIQFVEESSEPIVNTDDVTALSPYSGDILFVLIAPYNSSGLCTLVKSSRYWSLSILSRFPLMHTVSSQITTINGRRKTVNTIYMYMQVWWPLCGIRMNQTWLNHRCTIRDFHWIQSDPMGTDECHHTKYRCSLFLCFGQSPYISMGVIQSDLSVNAENDSGMKVTFAFIRDRVEISTPSMRLNDSVCVTCLRWMGIGQSTGRESTGTWYDGIHQCPLDRIGSNGNLESCTYDWVRFGSFVCRIMVIIPACTCILCWQSSVSRL